MPALALVLALLTVIVSFPPVAAAQQPGKIPVGWIPGTNIVIEYRYAEGKLERLPELAAELVRLPADVIVARAGISIKAVQHATRTIPIVMSVSQDPVREGFVASREALPKLTRVGVVRNPTLLEAYEEPRKKIEAAARALRVEIMEFPVRRREDLARWRGSTSFLRSITGDTSSKWEA